MIPLKFFKHAIQFSFNLNVQVTHYLMLCTTAALFTVSEPSSIRASDFVVWSWNAPHRLDSLNTWLLVDVTVWEYCGTCRIWRLDGKGGSLGIDLETCSPSHIQSTLSPEYRFSVPSHAPSFSYHLSCNKTFLGETKHTNLLIQIGTP